MNILYLTNEIRYTCGVSNHLYHLINTLSSNRNIKIFLITGYAEAKEKFEKLNINLTVNELFFHENRSRLNYLKAVKYLYSFINKYSINLIHSHSHYCANISKSVSKFTALKTIQTNHGIWKHKGRLKQFNADKYIAINEHIKDFLIKSKLTSEKNISFIRCGIPIPDKFKEKNITVLKILCTSRMLKQKGVHIFISAVSKLSKEYLSYAEFLIAGEGSDMKYFSDLSKELNTDIKFLGRVSDIYSLFEQSNIFVFSGLTSEEGFPAVLTEAAANSNIIITSDFLGVRCVFDEEEVLFYKPGDVDGLLKLLKQVLKNPEKYLGHAEKAYKKIKKEFQLTEMAEKHLKLYNECLG